MADELHSTKTVKESTGHTPFSLVYETEVVLPMEMIVYTTRTAAFVAEDNEETMRRSMDLVDENRNKTRHNRAI